MQFFPLYGIDYCNSYFFSGKEGEGVLVDPNGYSVKRLKKQGYAVKYVLLTHGHYDHIAHCKYFQDMGAKIGCLDAEKNLVEDEKLNLSRHFGVAIPPIKPDFTFSDGEELNLSGVCFRVLATPGHTAGSCCFLVEDKLISGDTLFCGSFGRTDFPTGDFEQLKKSIRKLFSLDGDYEVYPGHEEETTLSQEREYNGILKLW